MSAFLFANKGVGERETYRIRSLYMGLLLRLSFGPVIFFLFRRPVLS